MTEKFNDSLVGTLKKSVGIWWEDYMTSTEIWIDGFTKNNYSQWICKSVIVLILTVWNEYKRCQLGIFSFEFKAKARNFWENSKPLNKN